MPRNTIFEDFQSRHFKVQTINDAVVKGFYIVDKKKSVFTPWSVGSEGVEEYEELKRIFRHEDRDTFEKMCKKHFTNGATVYNTDGQMGVLNRLGKFEKDA